MKYSIHGFQQDKLIANNLTTEDALILRMIKDLYSTTKMEFIEHSGVRYMWINYTYMFEQIPIIGSKRNLMRRIERYGNELFIIRILKHYKGDLKGNFSYIAPTEKLDELQDFDLMTESHKVMTESHNPYDENGITLMTESHNKDTSIIYPSISDTSCNKNINDKSLIKNEQMETFEVFRNAFTGQKNGLETEFANFTKKNKNYAEILPLLFPAIEIENQYRQEALDLGVFFPVSKSIKTWINQKCWEQELQKPVQNNKTKQKEQQRELFEFEKEAKGKYDGL